SKRVVCYYTNWSVYRPGTAKFSPQNINPYLCTHLIYAFGGLTRENGIRAYDKYQDIEQGGYAKFTGLKSYNKKLKTLLAIGGWNEGSARFSPMVADPERRAEFVKNSVRFLRTNHFDGLDLDWEYPAYRDGGKPADRDNYAALVQELREEYLDFMNILSYDYHSAFESSVNHHSPLYPVGEDDEYNFEAALSILGPLNPLAAQLGPVDYEYYDDEADAAPSATKVKIHGDGWIECLDRGNFPHPFSCRKFISCAKMESGDLQGWEYTCPRGLSFDPIGGICNWSAGLGCKA
ncbi:hypothetical protein FOCC_FOCC015729, partial [Frankliniella occidentalis]